MEDWKPFFQGLSTCSNASLSLRALLDYGALLLSKLIAGFFINLRICNLGDESNVLISSFCDKGLIFGY
jgi:hypothetical protein